jgi:hypothetical protein
VVACTQVTVLRVFDRIVSDVAFLRSTSGREVGADLLLWCSCQCTTCPCTVLFHCCCIPQCDCQHLNVSFQHVMKLQVGTFVKKVLRNMFARLMPPPADADADTPAAAEAAGATSSSHPSTCFTTANCLQAPALSRKSVLQGPVVNGSGPGISRSGRG